MKANRFRNYVLAASLVMGISSLSLAAQSAQNQTPKPVYRSTTRLVVVDVVATDDKGAPVTGLKAKDFTVTENGEEQTLADFSFHQASDIAKHHALPPTFCPILLPIPGTALSM